MIEIDALTRRYGSNSAVDSLGFTAGDGIVTGFIGPNGAGKSTTLRILLGLEEPDAGTAHIDGRRYGELDRPMTQVGALLDAGWVHPGRTAHAHLRWVAHTGRIDPSRVDAALNDVGLHEVSGKRVGGFSLGMRQRLGLAAAMLGEPQHLVLDEPLNGLDPDGVHWMRRFIRDYAARGACVLVSSHLLSEMAITADRLAIIGQGRLIGQYDTGQFVRSATASAVRVRVDRGAELHDHALRHGWTVETADDGTLSLSAEGIDTDAVGRVCFDLGLRVDELTEVAGSLEEAFLAATGDTVEYHSGAGAVGFPARPTTDDQTMEVSR